MPCSASWPEIHRISYAKNETRSSISHSPCGWKIWVARYKRPPRSPRSLPYPPTFRPSAVEHHPSPKSIYYPLITPTKPFTLDMDVITLSQHYAQMAQALRSFMPSTCRSIDPEEVKPIGSRPVAAGGFAEIWEATHDGRKVALKAYRCYMTFGVARVIEVHCDHRLRRVVHC